MAEAEVPRKVITEDQRLDTAHAATIEALARHRWHWTLDESNAKRVSVRAYAKAIGRHERRVRAQVNGYATWTDQGADGTGRTPVDGAGVGFRTLDECIERAKVSAEKEAVIDAVAKAKGVTFGSARKDHQAVDTATAIAASRAERRGSTVADEIHGAAEHMVKSREAAAKGRDRRRKEHSWQWMEVEGHLAYAQRRVQQALTATEGVEFDAEERDLMAHALDKLRATLALIDLRLSGRVDVDWDAELAKLGDES